MPESYTGDEGNEALAAGLDVMDGGEKWGGVNGGWRAINKTRDMIARLVAGVTRAWTTAATAAAARTALGIPDIAPGGNVVVNGIPTYDASGRMVTNTPATPGDVANKAYVDSVIPEPEPLPTHPIFVDVGVTGAFYTPNRTAAVTSYVAAAINGPDGRIGTFPSALKYKRDIEPYDGTALPLEAVTYVLKDDPKQTRRVGVVADQANEIDPLLVVHEDGEVESFKYELLAVALLRDVQRLAARVDQLEAGE